MQSLCLSFALLLAISTPVFAQSEWTMCSRDRACTSWAQQDPSFAPPFTRRLLQLGSPVAEQLKSSADFLTYAGGTLFIGMGQRNGANLVFALDPATGLARWSTEVRQTSGAIGMAPVVSGGIVVAGGQGTSAYLHGFDRFTGSLTWSRLLGNMFARQVAIDGDWAYVYKDTLLALNAQTGAIFWSRPLPGAGPGRIVIDDTRIYYQSRDTLHAAAKNNGTLIWASPAASREGLCLDAERIYVSTRSGVRAVRKTDGSTAWTHTIPNGKTVGYIDGNGMALDSGRLVYVVWSDKDSHGTITALDPRTGAHKWTHILPGEGATAPVLVNNTVYVVNWSTYHLFGFDLETGAIRFRDTTHVYRTMPIVANGRMYVGVMNPDSLGYAIAEFTPTSTRADASPVSPAIRLQTYPNPFSRQTSASITLARAAHVRIDVVDVLGRVVGVVRDGWMQAGEHVLPVMLDAHHGAEAAGVLMLRCLADDRNVQTLHVQRMLRMP